MPRLALSMLGALQVTLDGQPATGFESVKARALLVYLAVESDRPHTRDHLAGLFWPDQPDPAARTNLRQTLANLRLVLGDRTSPEPFLQVSRESVQFNSSSDHWLDTSAFTSLIAACVQHPHRRPQTCKTCAARLEQAAALYRGSFLDQFYADDSAPFEEWVLVKQEDLRRLALDALARLAEYDLRRGTYDQALEHAVRLLQFDPWSEQAYRQAMRAYAARGERSAALQQYEACRRVLAVDMHAEPSEETTAVYEAIKTERGRRNGENHPSPPVPSLPIPPTPFVGREKEVADLADLLANPACRLISIIGPGGIGKTRLALATAADQSDQFEDGAVFVPLAAQSSADHLAPAIMAALGLPLEGPRDALDQLLIHLRERPVLIVLDNLEHISNGARLLSAILRETTEVALLVTSRERLNLQGEWVVDLHGLEIPEGSRVERVEEYSAVRLFLQSARRARADRLFSDEDKSSIVRICRLVEGMPLAIELAAAWVRTLSCREIAEETGKGLSLFATRLHDVPERHRSMHRVFEHSWTLLQEQERSALRRLSVFRGGFQREAAEQVAGASLPLLAALVDKSLVRAGSMERYSMHELVRQFAEGKLIECGELEETCDRRLAYFIALVEQTVPHMSDPEPQACLERLDMENGNLRATLEWCFRSNGAREGLRLSGALWRFWYLRGYYNEGRRWLERALAVSAHDIPAVERRRPLDGVGVLAWMQADYVAARAYIESSLAISRDLGDSRGVAYSLRALGTVARDQGDVAESRSFFQASLALYRELGDRPGIAHSTRALGIVTREQGEHAASRSYFEEARMILEEIGDRRSMARLLINMGESARVQGDYDTALSFYSQGSAIAQELGDQDSLVICLQNSASAIHCQGDHARATRLARESLRILQGQMIKASVVVSLALLGGLAGSEKRPARALRLFAAAETLRDAIGFHFYYADQVAHDRDMAAARAQLDEATCAAAWAEGRAMTLDQAMAYALEE
jgi:predicted ATPase/DNA-binding SARP family transcriptional activator